MSREVVHVSPTAGTRVHRNTGWWIKVVLPRTTRHSWRTGPGNRRKRPRRDPTRLLLEGDSLRARLAASFPAAAECRQISLAYKLRRNRWYIRVLAEGSPWCARDWCTHGEEDHEQTLTTSLPEGHPTYHEAVGFLAKLRQHQGPVSLYERLQTATRLPPDLLNLIGDHFRRTSS